MKDTQLLTIEIGDKCNLVHEHMQCPILLRKKGERELTDSMIVAMVKIAYEKLGFKGYVAWHYYNEPLLYKKRMFKLMAVLKETIKDAKFLLWTNGELLRKEKGLELFDRVVISNYRNRSPEYFKLFFKKQDKENNLSIIDPLFDNRLNIKGRENYETPCLRPYIEFIVSFYGDVHMCCQDWKNEIKIGNVFDEPFESLVKKRNKILDTISSEMKKEAPKTCITCTGRLPFLVRF